MKPRSGILYILLGTLFLLPSCTDADLDTTMYGGREDSAFYNNLEEINQSLTACYFYMKDSWNDMSLELMFINDCASDDCEKGGAGLTNEADIYQLETFNIFTTNSKVSQFWKMAYSAIYQVNTLLDKSAKFRAEHSDLTEDDLRLLTRYENEARWIRGLWYFNLAQMWGDVPLFLHAEQPDDIYKPRTPVEQIWGQVIDDFTAATALPKRSEYPDEDLGRVTSGAAYAMLGRTYWYNRNFDKAYEMLYILVEGEQKGEYELDPDFATQWLNANSNAKESVFEIQYVTNGKNWDESTGWNGVWFIPNCDGGYGFHLPTRHLLDAFDPEDPRITWTFVRQGDQFVGNDFVTKDSNYPNRYFDRKHFVPMCETLNAASPVYPQDTEATVYVIRYADVLLMYAEACLEKGDLTGAKKYLNQVRKRARESSPVDPKRVVQIYVPDTKPTSLPDITSDDAEVVRKAIWDERRFEFACEGVRRRDLMQQGRYGEIMQAVYANGYATEDVDKGRYYIKERELFPIPQSEVDLSQGALDNPGY